MTVPQKGKADYLELGDWNAACWECGRKFKASTLKKHWQGYWVCPEHWEPRQPQDFVRSVPDRIAPPWQQPQEDTFCLTCDWEGRMALGDVGIADCMIADFAPAGWDDGGFDPGAPGIPGQLDYTFILDESILS